MRKIMGSLLFVSWILLLSTWYVHYRDTKRLQPTKVSLSSEQQLRDEIADLKQQLARKPIGRKVGEIEFKLQGQIARMDEMVLDGQEGDWPSVACTSTIAGDRDHRSDRSLEFGAVRIYPIKTIDLK